MAEKKVSVRLSAVGGRQVRAELEGVGDAGARGFGRLSSEMEMANARLGSFARKAGIALSLLPARSRLCGQSCQVERWPFPFRTIGGRNRAHRHRPHLQARRAPAVHRPLKGGR